MSNIDSIEKIARTLNKIADEFEYMASTEYDVDRLNKIAHMLSAINGLSILKSMTQDNFYKDAGDDFGYKIALEKNADYDPKFIEDLKTAKKIIDAVKDKEALAKSIEETLQKHLQSKKLMEQPGVLEGLNKVYRALFGIGKGDKKYFKNLNYSYLLRPNPRFLCRQWHHRSRCYATECRRWWQPQIYFVPNRRANQRG